MLRTAEAPMFFLPQALSPGEILALPEDAARHIGQVLRMTAGEPVLLTDGKGSVASCVISEAGKKKVSVRVGDIARASKPAPALHLAVAFTRNTARNEWLLEKAAELGVARITPLITERSIRERVRQERWNAILVSAMLQSRQCWLPLLDAPQPFASVLDIASGQRLIAHCMGDTARTPLSGALKKGLEAQILIGPEGDFTPAEVSLATAAGALAVSLGGNRLRTETAALAVLTHFYLLNYAS